MNDILVTRTDRPIARLLLAHGAGAPMDSPFMNSVAAAIAATGIEVVRFEFPYMAGRRHRGEKRPPDKQPVLLVHWEKQVERHAKDDLPLFIGGKSMGGRMATLWAAAQPRPEVRGVICLGYPFHPPGKPQQLRIDHLHCLSFPLLILQGERDKLGCRSEVEGYRLDDAVQIKWLSLADHDLKPLVRSGITHADALTRAASEVVKFVKAQI